MKTILIITATATPAGNHDAVTRAYRHRRDFVRLRNRPGERASACGGRAWRTLEAHGGGGRELAGPD